MSWHTIKTPLLTIFLKIISLLNPVFLIISSNDKEFSMFLVIIRYYVRKQRWINFLFQAWEDIKKRLSPGQPL